ncbi:MAG: hypothetical protein IBV52_05295 [Candidatus Bathyarchaeota archaeon]
MQKRKRLALLSLLLVLSVGSAVVAQASGVLQSLADIKDAEINIHTTSVSLILTSEDRVKAEGIVDNDYRIKELVAGAEQYTISASEVFDIHESSFVNDFGEIGIELIPKEGYARVTVTISRDYGDKFGEQTVKATVDLVKEKVTEIEVEPEIRKSKVNKATMTITELVQNASLYDGGIVTVYGEVSLLGEVWGYLFMLDETVTVFYRHQEIHSDAETNLDVSGIENGDTVLVTGKFSSPNTLYAMGIEKINNP